MAGNRTPEQTVRAWNERYSKQDPAGAAEFMAEDVVRLSDSNRWAPIYKQGWIAMQAGFFPAFPDWTWEITSLIAVDSLVVCEFHEHGTFTRPYARAAGLELSPTGESYDDRSSIYFQVNEDSLISEIRAYYTNNLQRTYSFGARIAAWHAEHPEVSVAY